MVQTCDVGDVRETKLPGVGVRHEFATQDDQALGVIVHHDGRREILVYDVDDPDACTSVVQLSAADTHVLAELLGVSPVTETVTAVQQAIDSLALEWVEVGAGSSVAGTSIGAAALRTRTGASVVAVLRGDQTVPSPGPDFVFHVGDVAVAVGEQDGLVALRELLTS